MDINENQVTPNKGEDTSSPLRDVSDDESELPWAMYRSLDPAYSKNDEDENEDWGLDGDEDITGKYFMFACPLCCADSDLCCSMMVEEVVRTYTLVNVFSEGYKSWYAQVV